MSPTPPAPSAEQASTPVAQTPPEASASFYFSASPEPIPAPTPAQTPAAVTPQPQQEPVMPQNPESSKPRSIIDAMKRHKKWSITSATLVVLAVVTGVIMTQTGVLGGDSELARQFMENAPFEYKKPLENVDPKKKFTFSHSITPPETKSSDGEATSGRFTRESLQSVVGVYSDPLLKRRVEADISGNNREIEVKPAVVAPEFHNETANDSVALSVAGEWGLHAQYYLAQFVDFKTGEKLQKPIVTPFSVKQSVDIPTPAVFVTETGTPSFKWSAVEGAQKYYIVAMSVPAEGSRALSQLLGETTETEWTLEEETYAGRAYSQNEAFILSRGLKRLDALLVDGLSTSNEIDKVAAENKLLEYQSTPEDTTYIGVIAYTGEDYSAIGEGNIDELRPQMPLDLATQTAAQKYKVSFSQDSFDKLPATYPVVMVDGSIAQLPVIYELDKVYIRTPVGASVPGAVIPYKIKGTLFGGTATVDGSRALTLDQAKSELASVIAKHDEQIAGTGMVARTPLPDASIDLSSFKVSKTKPSVPYEIHASNPLTEYIAANMLNGERLIDISAFTSVEGVFVDVNDAINEAIYQNPLIFLYQETSGGYTYLRSKNLIYVDYGLDGEKMKKDQQATYEKAKAVIASIINPTMSERDKAVAINNYLVSNVEYDPLVKRALLDPLCYSSIGSGIDRCLERYGSSISARINNWTPYGALIDGVAVCVGYAEAFLVLAHLAGLEAVQVVGITDGNGHAWNRVKIDGKWRNIDVTWNDKGNQSSDKWLFLTDAELNAKRDNTVFDSWMADVLIEKYAAV